MGSEAECSKGLPERRKTAGSKGLPEKRKTTGSKGLREKEKRRKSSKGLPERGG